MSLCAATHPQRRLAGRGAPRLLHISAAAIVLVAGSGTGPAGTPCTASAPSSAARWRSRRRFRHCSTLGCPAAHKLFLRAAKVAAAAVTAAPRLQLLCLWLPLFLLLPIHCHRLRCATATTAGRQPGHQQLLQKAVSNHGAQLLH